jgi:hypothetical protein
MVVEPVIGFIKMSQTDANISVISLEKNQDNLLIRSARMEFF